LADRSIGATSSTDDFAIKFNREGKLCTGFVLLKKRTVDDGKNFVVVQFLLFVGHFLKQLHLKERTVMLTFSFIVFPLS
jgi:hypothetical protein